MYLRDELSPYGLNTAEGTVLLTMFSKNPAGVRTECMHSKYKGGKTQEELIERLHYDKGVMTRTMKALEKKGYVSRNNNPDDSRSFVFTLTEQGNDFRNVLIKIMRAWSVILLARIGDDELEMIGKALDTMSENAIGYYNERVTKKSDN